MTSQMKKSPTSPADNVVALYQEHARAFERQRSRDLFERGWLTRFLALLPASGKPRVLDIGCGNGVPIARHLIEQGCEIMGVDTSLPLLAGAQAAFPDHRWIAADMRRMPLNETFHGLIAWHSFSSEARRPAAPVRHLRTPGRARRAADVHQRDHTGEAIGELEGQPLYHGSLDRQEYRDLLEANGFEVVRYVEWDEECGRANVWLARRGGAVEGETRQPRITAVPARSVAVDEVLRIPDEPGRFSLSPSPDWMVRRRSEEAGALFGLCAEGDGRLR